MMVAWGICQGLAVTYQNHYYTAAGVIHRQEDGGPQGVCTAVEASEIYMLAFDRKFLVKLVKLGITLVLYERYVDDITVSGCSLKPGWSYSREKDAMVFKAEQVETDSLIPEDQRAMRELCKIADTIDPNLKFEVDCPSLHVEQAVPILDLMVWVDGGVLRHRFYQKDCAPERTIMANTALSWRTKRSTIFRPATATWTTRSCPSTWP